MEESPQMLNIKQDENTRRVFAEFRAEKFCFCPVGDYEFNEESYFEVRAFNEALKSPEKCDLYWIDAIDGLSINYQGLGLMTANPVAHVLINEKGNKDLRCCLKFLNDKKDDVDFIELCNYYLSDCTVEEKQQFNSAMKRIKKSCGTKGDIELLTKHCTKIAHNIVKKHKLGFKKEYEERGGEFGWW